MVVTTTTATTAAGTAAGTAAAAAATTKKKKKKQQQQQQQEKQEKNEKNHDSRIRRFVTNICVSPRKLVYLSATLIVLLHLFLLILQYDFTPRGRAKKWLRRHNIRPLSWTMRRTRSKQGNVVVFLRLPKTAGLTVQTNLAKKDYGILLRHPHSVHGLELEKNRILNILQRRSPPPGEEGATHFVVLHGEMADLPKIKTTLEEWRFAANQHRTTLFMFTILRDPLEYHVSMFNEYRVEPCMTHPCIKPILDPTSENLLQDMKPNDQCRLLVHGNNNNTSAVTEEECNQVYEWMTMNLDWIGTAGGDNLKTHTLPLLAQLMLGDADRLQYFEWDVAVQPIKERALTTATVTANAAATVRQRSNLDQQLYEKIKAKYYI